MLLIGENIHIISKSVREALENRNRAFIESLIKMQLNMDFIDLNIGPARGKLEGVMSWLTDIAQNISDKGISFDTSNFTEIQNGFEVLKNKQSAFINSTSRDEEKLELLTDTAAEYGCNLIALTMSKETGIPKTSDGRLELAFEIYEKCMEKGIDNGNIYFDPLVLPVSVEQSQALEVLNTIKMIKESFDPPVKTVIGLSNISNGSPQEIRPLINRVFGVMAYGAGLDAAIIDAKDTELVRILKMLKENTPHSNIDELYINIAHMVENFSGLDEVQYDKDDIEQVKIIKTTGILLGKSVYSHSFTQI